MPATAGSAEPIRMKLDGAGRGWPFRENVMVKVGAGEAPTISVPIASQSGSRNSSRVQACKSVEPAGNGVPGVTIGLGAESQKKLPVASVISTCGTKK